jgi:hypothetical protein
MSNVWTGIWAGMIPSLIRGPGGLPGRRARGYAARFRRVKAGRSGRPGTGYTLIPLRKRGTVIPFPTARLAASAPLPPPTPSGERGLLDIYRCDQAEALVVKGLLESAGIPALLRSRLAQSVHPFSVGAQGEVAILVPENAAPRARRLLTRLARNA